MQGASIAAGFVQGMSTLIDDKYAQHKARTTEAGYKQQKALLELQEFQANAQNRRRTEELQLQKLEAETQTANRNSLAGLTTSSLDRFTSDGNVKHLNTWLRDAKKNPIGNKLYGEVARYDSLTKSENSDKLLKQAGFKPEDIYDDPELASEFIVVTQNTGEQVLLPKEILYATTGYTDYLGDKELSKLEKSARIQQMLRAGTSKAKITLQERVVEDLINDGKAASTAEAYEILKEMERAKRGEGVLSSTEERAVARIMETENVGYLEALDTYYSTKRQGTGETNEGQFIKEYLESNEDATYEEAAAEYKNLGKTSTQKQQVDIQKIRTGLDEMGWLESKTSDFSSVDRARVYRDYIAPLEDLRNFKLTTEEKRMVRNLRELTGLGKTAGEELTPEETGFIDNTFLNFKKYMSDNVEGKRGVAAYESFRNVFRHALYGSALTKHEISAFNKAAGSLKEQFNPVMTALQVQMETIKSNLESIRDLNDPDIAHYYTGQSIEEVDEVIANIENVMNDPRLRHNRTQSKGSIKVKRVQPVEPTVDDEASADFDFDRAMQEANL